MGKPQSSRTRRELFRQASAGMALAVSAGPAAGQTAGPPSKSRLPREVWVASISQVGLSARDPDEMIKAVLARMEETVPYQPDIVCTPEVFAFSGVLSGNRPVAAVAEKPIGPVCGPFADFAKKNHCYVVCSTYTKEDGRNYIAAVLLDRSARVVGEYRKIHPTVGEMESGVSRGRSIRRSSGRISASSGSRSVSTSTGRRAGTSSGRPARRLCSGHRHSAVVR